VTVAGNEELHLVWRLKQYADEAEASDVPWIIGNLPCGMLIKLNFAVEHLVNAPCKYRRTFDIS